MHKKIVSFTLAVALGLSILSMSAFAGKVDESKLQGKNNEVVYTDKGIEYRYTPDAADPTPYADNAAQASSIVVTASDVWLETQTGGQPSGYYDTYRAYGYVTASQYHYAKAVLKFSFGDNVGDKHYGYGKVDAWTSWTDLAYGKAYIYYG